MICDKRIIFILKQRSSYGVSYGLANSCKFIANTLEKCGATCKVVEVVDNNSIDREVTLFKPTHAFVEALWVVPEKFKVLLPKHPKVKWSVRIHSKTPFLAMEGIAMEWIWSYENELAHRYNNFSLASNAYITTCEFNELGIDTINLPNIYYPNPKINVDMCLKNLHKSDPKILDIGCFGSIRPLKNHLQQATAAIIFADNVNKKMRFHVNSNRVEQKGEPIIKNLENLFKNTDHTLVKHEWMNHDTFLKLVETMELGLQVSFSETFNIVAADFVYKDVPVVGSADIEWLSEYYKADPTDYRDIVSKLESAYNNRRLGIHWLNKYNLWKHNRQATEKWLDYLVS